ncbi:MAG: thiamine pyrophosphate-dependent enzyme, partial [Burkholderiaceae bacterium]|nr:thiamine pyrophosphate-dependent enzyme [Burkholderiaceae bacterium]
PGVTNVITALKNAQLAQSPVVVLGGAAPTALQGRGALQDIDQRALVAPHVKRFLRVHRVRELAPAVTAALRIAGSGVPGPVFVECAVDLLYPEATVRAWYAQGAPKGGSLAARVQRAYLHWHLNRLFAPGGGFAVQPVAVPPPPDSAVRSAAAALGRAERPLAVIGSQALADANAAAALADAVTQLGVPVYLSGMARGLLGRTHPLLLRHRRREALREADCVLLAGVPCDFRLDYGGQIRRTATVIAANRSRRDATLNRRPQVLALGDAGQFLQALAQRVRPAAAWSAWLAALRARDAERDAEIERQAAVTGAAVNALALLRALDEMAADDALFVADGGDFVATASYVLRPRAPLSWLDPGPFGTLGVGAGFALGAALARPAREVWLLYGDGACGFSLAEFDTFVRHGIAVIAVVGNDGGWTQIAREQVKLLGDDVGTVLARSAYHAVAEGFGAAGLLVRRPQEVVPALRKARALAQQGRPVLVNVWLDRSDFREGSISM